MEQTLIMDSTTLSREVNFLKKISVFVNGSKIEMMKTKKDMLKTKT